MTNKITIENVQFNLSQVMAENSNIEQLKARNYFKPGPAQEASYKRLWEEVQALKGKAPDIKIEVVKDKKKK